jgi:hypothetical protein
VTVEPPAAAQPATFSPSTIITLVLVALFAFSAFGVLSTYAPELRGAEDPGAHALSRSGLGFAGAAAFFKAQGTPVIVSRAPNLSGTQAGLVVLTPFDGQVGRAMERLVTDRPTLVVLPKWSVGLDPLHRGWVRKVGADYDGEAATKLLSKFARTTAVARREGVAPAELRLGPNISAFTPEGRPIAFGIVRTGPIDRLQTISGRAPGSMCWPTRTF